MRTSLSKKIRRRLFVCFDLLRIFNVLIVRRISPKSMTLTGTSISVSKYDSLYQSESQIKETSEQLQQGKRLLIYGKGKIVMRFHPTSKKVVDFKVVCKRTGAKPSTV